MSAKRKTIELFTRILARAYRNQRIRLSPDSVNKVNLGCGLQVAPGWTNVDGSINAWVANRPAWVCRLAYRFSGANQYYNPDDYHKTLTQNRFVFHNILNGLPFADQTVDFLFSSHFLEHLDKASGAKMLKECFRVLKQNGVVRIGVPDLEYAWELYRNGKKDLMLHDFFFTGTETSFSQHRYAYDFELLERALREAGFGQVCRAAFRQGATPDLELLDNRGDYTLFVEARRVAV